MAIAQRGTFHDDFIYGGGTFGTSASATTPWRVTDTSAAGTPTYQAGVDNGTSGGAAGLAKIGLEATNEVQNVCLSFGDVLQFDIDDDLVFECRLRAGQSAWDTATQFAFGLTGDRNDTIDSIAQLALFRVIGADSTTAVVVETDDGTTDNDDKATQLTLTTGYRVFRIDLTDLTNVKFLMSDDTGRMTRVAPGTTFNMSAYAGCLQPFFQLQKTADTNTDYVEIDYVRVEWARNT